MDESSADTTDVDLINYAPASPAFSPEFARLERAVRSLLRRRGGLRGVASDGRRDVGR